LRRAAAVCYKARSFLRAVIAGKEMILEKNGNSGGFSSVLFRAVVLAVLYPVLKGVGAGWADLARRFPGSGAWPYLLSGAAFVAFFLSLAWLLGTAPAGWLKSAAGGVWRRIVLKRLSALGKATGGKDSWAGRFVLYAEAGRFGEEEVAPVFSPGVVTADFGDWVYVLLISPPGLTCRWFCASKRCGRLWLTDLSFEDYGKAVVSFGNSADPKKFLPKSDV
jgi:hypothetical protein